MLNIFNKLSAKLSPILAKYLKRPASSEQEHNPTLKNSIILAILSIITIALFATSTIQWLSYSESLSQDALDNNEAVFVNIITDEIFNGKLYVKEEQTEEKPSESVELTATSEENENSPKKYRSSEELANKNTNKIAIVITNLGLNKSNTLSALNLRKEFTLGFTPYAMDLEDWVSQATTKGFEALINIPMQPLDYPVNDPGPLSMLLNLSNNENLSRLSQIMLKSEKAVGFYSEQSEVFSQSKSSFTPIAAELAKSKHLFLYGNTSNSASVSEICKSVTLECQVNSLILDQELDEEAIKKQLLALEGVAYAKGFAVGFIRAYPLTMNILKNWADGLNPDALSLVPISITLSASQNNELRPILPSSPAKEDASKEVDKKDAKPSKKPEDKTTEAKEEPSLKEEKASEKSESQPAEKPEQKSDDASSSSKEEPKVQSKDKPKEVKQQKSTPKKQQAKDTKQKKKPQANSKIAAKSDQQ